MGAGFWGVLHHTHEAQQGAVGSGVRVIGFKVWVWGFGGLGLWG